MKNAWKPQPQSAYQRAMGFAFFVVIGAFIVGTIVKVFDLLVLSPIRYLLTSRDLLIDQERKKEYSLKEMESQRRMAFRDSLPFEDNQMNRYLERYVLHPERYVDDPQNETYLQWYKDWKAGRVLDSDLRWIPEDKIGKDVNPDFANYLELQLNLHEKNGTSKEKKLFLRAIVQPDFESARSFVEAVKFKAGEGSVRATFVSELEKEGIPEELADFILKKDLGGEEIMELVKWLEPFVDKGHSTEVLKMAIHTKGDLSEDQIDAMQELYISGVNILIAYPMAMGVITADEALFLNGLYDSIDSVNKKNGLSKGDKYYQCPEDIVKETFGEIVAKKKVSYNGIKMDKETGKAVWEN